MVKIFIGLPLLKCQVIRMEFRLVMIIMDMVGRQILEETVSADI